MPDRVLLANPGDHPTIETDDTARRALRACLEETPEARHLNVKRLKDVIGKPRLCRPAYIQQDTVEWDVDASSLFRIHRRPAARRRGRPRHLAPTGSWSTFPHTYRKPGEPFAADLEREGDPTLRDRLKHGHGGRHQAVLAWVVRGAVDWYRNGCVLPLAPANVAADTRAWREDSDAILGYITENLVFDDDWHVMSTDLLNDFNHWLKARGHREWSDQTLGGRLKDHVEWQQVKHQKVLASRPGRSRPRWVAGEVPKQYRAWLGVRFRTHADDPENDEKPHENPQAGQGGRGTRAPAHDGHIIQIPR